MCGWEFSKKSGSREQKFRGFWDAKGIQENSNTNPSILDPYQNTPPPVRTLHELDFAYIVKLNEDPPHTARMG